MCSKRRNTCTSGASPCPTSTESLPPPMLWPRSRPGLFPPRGPSGCVISVASQARRCCKIMSEKRYASLDENVRSYIVRSWGGALTWQGPLQRQSCAIACAERREHQSGTRARLEAKQQHHDTSATHRHVLLWLLAPSAMSSHMAPRLPHDGPAQRGELEEQQLPHEPALQVWSGIVKLEAAGDSAEWNLVLPEC